MVAAAFAGERAAALDIETGDLVGVFQKGGKEVVVNLGPARPGARLDLADTLDVPEFDGVAGVKFIALAVEDPGRTINCCGGNEVPQPNIIFTTPQPLGPVPPPIFELGCAVERVEVLDPLALGTWFNILRAQPGTDSELWDVTNANSYEQNLGFGTDAIANCLSGISTAAVFDSEGQLEVELNSVAGGLEDVGGPPGTAEVIVDMAFDGTTLDLFEPVPEPAAALTTLVGAAVMACARRRVSSQS